MSEIIKKLSVIIAVVALSACQPTADDRTGSYHLPPELDGCKVFRLRNDNGAVISVVRCPAMDTITTCHKNGKSTMCNSVVTGG